MEEGQADTEPVVVIANFTILKPPSYLKSRTNPATNTSGHDGLLWRKTFAACRSCDSLLLAMSTIRHTIMPQCLHSSECARSVEEEKGQALADVCTAAANAVI
jgi:hypothetical protein